MSTYLKTNNKIDCTNCQICMIVCPVSCIRSVEDNFGFAYPAIDKEKCINCNMCVKSCHEQSIFKTEAINRRIALKNNCEKEIMTSTSGGVFIELAKYTLSIGGYVCGAIIDNNLEVCHILSNKLTDIEQMKKSKYVDSNIKDCFQEIKSLINKGIYVLFSGTPCQVAAIIQYIGRNKYLITCDFLCSGCSSPIVFKKYIHYLEDEYKSKLISFDFRTKSLCWVHPAFEIDFENEKVIIKHEDSAYYWLFANGASNKPCCSNCRYIENKISDITLGDCWGINENDKIYDEFGVSYININTQKGEEIFDEISMNFTYRELFNGEYPQYRQIHKPTDIVDKELFFRYIQNHNFLETTKIFLPWQYKENFISEKIRQIKKELFRRGFIK